MDKLELLIYFCTYILLLKKQCMYVVIEILITIPFPLDIFLLFVCFGGYFHNSKGHELILYQLLKSRLKWIIEVFTNSSL